MPGAIGRFSLVFHTSKATNNIKMANQSLKVGILNTKFDFSRFAGSFWALMSTACFSFALVKRVGKDKCPCTVVNVIAEIMSC